MKLVLPQHSTTSTMIISHRRYIGGANVLPSNCTWSIYNFKDKEPKIICTWIPLKPEKDSSVPIGMRKVAEEVEEQHPLPGEVLCIHSICNSYHLVFITMRIIMQFYLNFRANSIRIKNPHNTALSICIPASSTQTFTRPTNIDISFVFSSLHFNWLNESISGADKAEETQVNSPCLYL